MDARDPLGLLAAVLLGLVVGSFLNVVISRLPEGRSLWAPRSACPRCGVPIAWYDNIPVVSFAVLRRRCRACGMPISWQYPTVEILTAVGFALSWRAFGPRAEFVTAAIVLSALIAITVIDLRHQIIPDLITLPGIVTGVVVNLASQRVPWLESILGIAVGGGLFFVIIVASRGGMGGGDMKLGAMLGAFLGWKVVLFSVFVAVLLGGVLAIGLLASGRRGRKDPIPFGPFLAAGGAVGLFCGERIVAWYLSGFRI
jgi:leader peptidase (prepilin peptidase)/N-methyltransferase